MVYVVFGMNDEKSGKHYSVEDYIYNVGSAYSYYRVNYTLEDSEVADLRDKARAREPSHLRRPCAGQRQR